MPSMPRPCSQRALALAVLLLFSPQQEQGMPAAAARSRLTKQGAGSHQDFASAGGASEDLETADKSQDVTTDASVPTAEYNASVARNLKRLNLVKDALQDMMANIDKEAEEEAKNFMLFNTWCESEISDFENLLSQATLAKERNEVTKTELEAKISQILSDAATRREEEQRARDLLAQKMRLNEEDEQKYQRDLVLNQQAISQMEQAVQALDAVHSQGGFLQNGVLKRLQLNAPGESSYVLGIMNRIRTSLEATRTQLMSSHEGAKEEAKRLERTEVESLSETKSEGTGETSQLTEARVALGEVNRDLAHAEEKIPEAEERLEHTQAHCEAKNMAWKARQQDRSDEKDAIMEAIMFIGQGVMEPLGQKQSTLEEKPKNALVQQGRHVGRGKSAELGVPVFTQVASTKNHGSGAAGSLAFVSAMLRSRSGDEVKQVVTDLLAELKTEQEQEDELVSECRTSLESKDGERSQSQDQIGQLAAAINLKNSTIDSLDIEVAELRKNLAHLEENMANATTLRNQERRMYNAQTSDRKLSLKVLEQARQVLKRFYASADLTSLIHMQQRSQRMRQRQALGSDLQLGAELEVETPEQEAPAPAPKPADVSTRELFSNMSFATPPPTFDETKSSKKTIEGFGVIALLERLKDEVVAEQRTADTEEQESVTAFQELQAATRAQSDDLMEEITERMQRQATLTVKMNSEKEDHAAAEEELGSIEKQIGTLHEKCDDKMAKHTERTKARSFEVSQLRDVLDILSGSQLAVRTGVARPEASLDLPA